jgi:hypothetical protein
VKSTHEIRCVIEEWHQIGLIRDHPPLTDREPVCKTCGPILADLDALEAEVERLKNLATSTGKLYCVEHPNAEPWWPSSCPSCYQEMSAENTRLREALRPLARLETQRL